MTDEEVEKMIKQRFERGRKMLDLREAYYDKYRQFLTPRQIERVYMIEKRMHEKMEGAGPRK